MRRLLPCLAVGLVALLSGCNPQWSNPFAVFGQPTIPPPGTSQGAGGDGYYPTGLVKLPLNASESSPANVATTAPTVTLPASPSPETPVPAAVSVGTTSLPMFTRSSSAEGAIRIVENPNPTVRTAAVTPRRGTIEAVPANTPVASSENSSDGLLEITRLPGNRGLLAPLPTTPTSSSGRGFIPALPQQQDPPKTIVPAVPAQPRFSNSRYDEAVAPAVYSQPATGSGNVWQAR